MFLNSSLIFSQKGQEKFSQRDEFSGFEKNIVIFSPSISFGFLQCSAARDSKRDKRLRLVCSNGQKTKWFLSLDEASYKSNREQTMFIDVIKRGSTKDNRGRN